MRLGREREARCTLVRHPCWDTGNRPVRLRDDDQLDATIGESSLNKYGLAIAWMERIHDPRLNRLLASSLSLFRATPQSAEYPCRPRADGSRRNGEANEARASCAAPPLSWLL